MSKGEIFGIMTQVWHYGIGVVLDGNSLKGKISLGSQNETK